jgi:hypothetical protein
MRLFDDGLIDVCPVGTPQVADHQFAILHEHFGMKAGDMAKVERER